MLARLSGVLVTFVIVYAGLEAGLRLAPGLLIPVGWLERFEPDLRTEIADRLELPSRSQVIEIERDDGGPPLLIPKPGSRTVQAFANGVVSTVDYDSQGFCNAASNSYERQRIELITLGDSFATCIGNTPEDGWPHLLGVATGMSVYGLGRAGIGPYEYLQLLQHLGLAKHPEIVVMQIYEGNDLRDSVRYHQHVLAASRGETLYASAADRDAPELPYERILSNGIGRTSYAANLATVAFGKLYDAARKTVAKLASGDVGSIDFRYDLVLGNRTVPFNVQNADQSEVRQARALEAGQIDLAAFDDALERFASLAEQHGFLPIVSYVPSAHTAYREAARFHDPALEPLLQRVSDGQRAHIARKLEALGVDFLDMTPSMQRAASERGLDHLLYSAVTVHLSGAGNRVVAERVAAEIDRLRADKP